MYFQHTGIPQGGLSGSVHALENSYLEHPGPPAQNRNKGDLVVIRLKPPHPSPIWPPLGTCVYGKSLEDQPACGGSFWLGGASAQLELVQDNLWLP